MILDAEQLMKILKGSAQVPKHIERGRETAKTMRALVDGKEFGELLSKIENIERSEDKWKARKNYARSIKDLNHRLLRPIDNVYSATGGSRKYLPENENQNRELIQRISRIRGNQSLTKWLQKNWMHLYITDPAGLIFMESSKDGEKVYPTYKAIEKIRDYKANGQNVEWVLFEPKDIKMPDNEVKKLYRLVDDDRDYRFWKEGNEFIEILEGDYASLDHPYNLCPGIINSDINEVGEDTRLSAIDEVIELQKEYLRDQSIKTIVKFLNGFQNLVRPKIICSSCHGTGKTGENKCKDCNATGFLTNRDVTDEIIIPIDLRKPDQKLPNARELANWIGLDTDTWDQYNDELKLLEVLAFQTLWGSHYSTLDQGPDKTATEVFVNTQPVMNRLNDFTDAAEFVEWQVTHWIANFIFPTADKNQNVSEINYGRRYIIDPPDAILDKYNSARGSGAGSIILDKLLTEYITAKYRSDQENLRRHLVRSRVEPYVHYTLQTVNSIFGNMEAQKKALFRDWWEMQGENPLLDDEVQLREQFNEWFNQNSIDNGTENRNPEEVPRFGNG